MSEFKGTKGKWSIYHIIDDKEENQYSVTSNNGKVCYCYNMSIPDYENKISKANAQLISKAPEMLEMLKEAKRVICSMKLSMWVHPDCSEDSEFYDMATTGEETEDKIEKIIKEATTI